MKNRREFILLSGQAALLGTGIWYRPGQVWQLIAPTALAQGSGPAEFRDIYVRGSGFQDVLTAAQWQAGQAVTLSKTVEPGIHDHPVIVGPAQFNQLNAGQTVTFDSETREGHEHQVSIRQNDFVPGGNRIPNIPNQTPTPVPQQPGPSIPSNPTSDGALAAMLGSGDEPFLYVEALMPIDSSTIFYCQGDSGSCSRLDWTVMRPAPVVPGRAIYQSKFRLQLVPGEVIHISANDRTGIRRELHLEVSSVGTGLSLKGRER